MLLLSAVDLAAVVDLPEETQHQEEEVEEDHQEEDQEEDQEEEEEEEEEESGTLIVLVDWLLPEILVEPELSILLEETLVEVEDLMPGEA